MKRVAFHNLGCKVNSYELDIMRQKMEEHGYISVPFEEEAEVYVINTCTVTNIADRKSRQMIHKAKKRNPDAVVIWPLVIIRKRRSRNFWMSSWQG